MNMWSGLLLFVGGVMKLSHGTSSFLQVFLMCYIKSERPAVQESYITVFTGMHKHNYTACLCLNMHSSAEAKICSHCQTHLKVTDSDGESLTTGSLCGCMTDRL